MQSRYRRQLAANGANDPEKTSEYRVKLRHRLEQSPASLTSKSKTLLLQSALLSRAGYPLGLPKCQFRCFNRWVVSKRIACLELDRDRLGKNLMSAALD